MKKEALIIAVCVALILLIAVPFVVVGLGSDGSKLRLPQAVGQVPTPVPSPPTAGAASASPASGSPKVLASLPFTTSPLPAPRGSMPFVIDLDVGESLPFILNDGSRRTVTLAGTRLVQTSGPVTVWATATVIVAGQGLTTQQAEIPAAYFRLPAVLNGVRVYVAITREFNDGYLRDKGGTDKAARLVLSDSQYTMTDLSHYAWPFPNLVWQEGSNVTYWQGLQGDHTFMSHHGAIEVGMPSGTPIVAWHGGTLRSLDRGYDRVVWLDPSDDGQSLQGAHLLSHAATVKQELMGSRVEPGTAIGSSGGSIGLKGELEWWHVTMAGGFQWGPMLAEWYTSHADPVAISYIKDWLVAGPYSSSNDGTRLATDYLGNEAAVQPVAGSPASTGSVWKLWDNVVPGVISVGDAVDPYPFSGWAWVNGNYPTGSAYLATYIYSESPRSVVFNVGSSDAFRVWLDGAALFSSNEFISDPFPGNGRTIIVDQYKVPATLKAGWNRLLVKAAQRDGSPPSWQMSVRITDQTGAPALDLKTSPTRDLSAPTVLMAPPLGAATSPPPSASASISPKPTPSPAGAALNASPAARPTPVPGATPVPTPTATRAVSVPTPTPARAALPPATSPSPSPVPGKPAWVSLVNTPADVADGGALASDGGSIYAFQGDRARAGGFWRYDVKGNRWELLAPTPSSVAYGAALVFGGGQALYAFRGDLSQEFWRYDIPAGAWRRLSDAPQPIGWGGALAWDGGGSIYALRGDSAGLGVNAAPGNEFWRYSIPSDSWTSLPFPPAAIKQGGALTVVGGSVYVLRGDRRRDFWRYDIAYKAWHTMQPAPEAVGAGASLAYFPGSDFIYALKGDGSGKFWRFSISRNSWEALPDSPERVDAGGALTALGGSVYALRGGVARAYWRYPEGPLTPLGAVAPGQVLAQTSGPSGEPPPAPSPAPSQGTTPQPGQPPTPTPQPAAPPTPTPQPCKPVLLVCV